MRTWIGLTLALATAISLAGCDTPQGQNATGGALLGGATGALLGSALSGGRPGATVVGAVAGAATGAMVASAATPQGPGYAPPPRRCAEFYYDYYGNRICRAYY
jgi:uncharacterized protein YcfJ